MLRVVDIEIYLKIVRYLLHIFDYLSKEALKKYLLTLIPRVKYTLYSIPAAKSVLRLWSNALGSAYLLETP